MKENKKNKVLFIVGGILLVVLIIGAAYAYFEMSSENYTTETIISGDADVLGTPVISTNITQLKLTLTPEAMHSDNGNKIYYATPDGTLSETQRKYVLATATLADGNASLNCTYKYTITGTSSNEITDNSDNDVKVAISSGGEEQVYTLRQILSGVEHTSNILGLSPGSTKNIEVKMYVENTYNSQNDLQDSVYTINIEPKTDEDAFKCKGQYNLVKKAKGEEIASFMATNYDKINSLWSSGLEGDGYRYIGESTKVCDYVDIGFRMAVSEDSTQCPTLYYVKTIPKDGGSSYYQYSTYCWSESDWAKYECDAYYAELSFSKDLSPNNYICFGTTDKNECLNTERDSNYITGKEKYLYRIVGVFPDSDGNYHLKLYNTNKLNKGVLYQENENDDIDWSDSGYKRDLNGEAFLNNTDYSYMQEDIWLNKIANWEYVSSKTTGWEQYYSSAMENIHELYLHEMNRSTNPYDFGSWNYSTSKIGLLYLSDYVLSIGDKAMNAKRFYEIQDFYKSSWLLGNAQNSESLNICFMARAFNDYNNLYFSSWDGGINTSSVSYYNQVNPTFYLTSDVKFASGTGTYNDPYIIEE